MAYVDLTQDQKDTLALVGITSDADLNATKARIAIDKKEAQIKEIVDRYELLFQAKQAEINALKTAKQAEIDAL